MVSAGEVDPVSLARAVGHDSFSAMVGPAEGYSLDGLQVRRIDGRPVWSATLLKWWEESKAPRVVERQPIAGAAVHTAAGHSTRAYRARHGCLPEQRDGWAALLADAAEAISQPPEPYLYASGWVVATTARESRNVDAVAAVAASFDALLARRGMPQAHIAPSTVDPPAGFRSYVIDNYWRYEQDVRFVPVEGTAPTPARLFRRHVRDVCGPEVETQLIVTWPRAAVPGLSVLAEYPRLVPRGDPAPGLLSDVDVAALRLYSHLGDLAHVVSEVRWTSDGIAVVGVDNPDWRSDSAVIAAATKTVPALPAICRSPGVDFALAQQLVSARTQRRARRRGQGTDPRGYLVQSAPPVNYLVTEGRKGLTLAWASRPAPGGSYSAEVADGRVVVGADHAPELDELTSVLRQHASNISPSRWFVTPQLVFASSQSASIDQLRSVFQTLNDS